MLKIRRPHHRRHRHQISRSSGLSLARTHGIQPQSRNRRTGLWSTRLKSCKKQGANTPIEGLRQLPIFVGTTATENDSNGGDGSAFINLYALGVEQCPDANQWAPRL